MDISKFIGIPYKLNGRSFKGCDCYGLYYLFQAEYLIKRVPVNVDERLIEKENFKEVFSEKVIEFQKVDDPRLGDIVLFRHLRTFYHVGIYLNEKEFLHVLSHGHTSAIEKFSSKNWKKKIVNYARYK